MRAPATIVLCAWLGAWGCGGDEPRRLDWTIAFASPADRASAHLVVASIRRGGCSATDVVWTETIRPDRPMGLAPPALDPGTWGFAARARDIECRWHAEGCLEVTLGEDMRPTSARTVMSSIPLDAECPLSMCAGGECAGVDADGGPRDGGMRDSGPGDGGPDAPATCDPADDACASGMLSTCDTTTGRVTTTACPAGCAPGGELRCARVVPSNVDASLLDESLPDVSMTSGGTIDTDACTPPFGDGMIISQMGGAPDLCVVRTGALTLGGTWTVTGARGLVLLAGGPVAIDGTLDVAARLDVPGPGGFGGGTLAAPNGLGPGGGGGGRDVSTSASGGGGGGLCGAGGDGGAEDTILGGAGGAPISAWDLAPLHGGSGGGLGADGSPRAVGGAGGGALQVTSSVSLVLTGAVHLGGGGGGGGGSSGAGIQSGAGGGGGSGGALLLEAPTVDVGTGAVVAASGGGGGGSADAMLVGSPGADALGSLTGPMGGIGGGTRGAAGGTGGAGSAPDGSSPPDVGESAGPGGGGGAGCVRIRSVAATLPSELGGFSPSVAPALRALPLLVE